MEIYTNFFSNNFNFSFVRPDGLMDSVIVTLFSGSNSCCQQNLKCFDVPLWFVFMKE